MAASGLVLTRALITRTGHTESPLASAAARASIAVPARGACVLQMMHTRDSCAWHTRAGGHGCTRPCLRLCPQCVPASPIALVESLCGRSACANGRGARQAGGDRGRAAGGARAPPDGAPRCLEPTPRCASDRPSCPALAPLEPAATLAGPHALPVAALPACLGDPARAAPPAHAIIFSGESTDRRSRTFELQPLGEPRCQRCMRGTPCTAPAAPRGPSTPRIRATRRTRARSLTLTLTLAQSTLGQDLYDRISTTGNATAGTL